MEERRFSLEYRDTLNHISDGYFLLTVIVLVCVYNLIPDWIDYDLPILTVFEKGAALFLAFCCLVLSFMFYGATKLTRKET